MSIVVQLGNSMRSLTGGDERSLPNSSTTYHDSEMSPVSTEEVYRRPVQTYPGCFGLPYQDHNYGAPPPVTPPPSPPPFKINGHHLEFNDLSKPTLIAKEEIVDDSITRCICEFQHDDGYMICCDQCSVWQHIDCMGIDRNSIPESYFCERCQVRPVDAERAKIIQARKKEEIANLDTSATDTDPEEVANRLAALNKKSPVKKVCKQRRNSKLKEKVKEKQKTKEKKGLKKEKENLKDGNVKVKFKTDKDGTQRAVKPKKCKRTASQTVCKVNGDGIKSESQEKFVDAKENQYSNDVKELFSRSKVNGIHLDDLHPKSDRLLDQLWCLGQSKKNQVVIEAKENILPGLAVLEYKGKVLLRPHFVENNLFYKKPHPHALFYSKFEDIDLCIDSSSYGNKARYIRKSCSPNAEVRHLVEHGRIHFVIFSKKEIDKGEEITIPFDYNYQDCQYSVECACSKNVCTVSKFWKKASKNAQNKGMKKTRLKRPSGNSPTKTELSPLKSEILKIKESIPQTTVKKEKKAVQIVETPPAVKQEPKPVAEKAPVVSPAPTTRVKHESGSDSQHAAVPSTNIDVTSPEKTDHDDHDHKMTREERKMNAIMKAFEKLEKREERRKEALARIDCQRKSQEETKKTPEIKTSSEDDSKGMAASEETSDTCTKEEQLKPETPVKNQRKGRKRPLRRRSRVNSTSAAECVVSADEGSNSTTVSTAASTPNTPIPHSADVSNTNNAGFKFIKTKKHLFNEWLTEKGNDGKAPVVPAPLEVKVDDTMFVPCLPSPRNAMEHLQRRNSQSAGSGKHGSESSRGSAKKRWLRQAMHEVPSSCDSGSTSPIPRCSSPTPVICSPAPGTTTTIGSPSPGITSPGSSPPIDFVTPLKKRRLARESLSKDTSVVSTPSNSSSVVQANGQECLPDSTKGDNSHLEGLQGKNGLKPTLPTDPQTQLNVSKCYKSDSDCVEGGKETSNVPPVMRLSMEVDNDSESVENNRPSDVLRSEDNSALNTNVDSGIDTHARKELKTDKIPEKMEVDPDSIIAEAEKMISISMKATDTSQELPVPYTSDNNTDSHTKEQSSPFAQTHLEDTKSDLLNKNSSENKNEGTASNFVSDSTSRGSASEIDNIDKPSADDDSGNLFSQSKSVLQEPSDTPMEDNVHYSDISTSTLNVTLPNKSDINDKNSDSSTNTQTDPTVNNRDLRPPMLLNVDKVESFGFVPQLTSSNIDSVEGSGTVVTSLPSLLSTKADWPVCDSTTSEHVSSSSSSSDNTVMSSASLDLCSPASTVASSTSVHLPTQSQTLNEEVTGSGEDSPTENTNLLQPSASSKKKVSLLEYRKRLKSKTKEAPSSLSPSSLPNNVHPIPTRVTGSSSSLTNFRSRTPSLPSLPLFVDKNSKQYDIKEKKSWHSLSLTERLRQEFGVEASEDDKSEEDKSSGVPPPPPSAPHPGHSHTAPPPPPPPPKGAAARIPSLMSIPAFGKRALPVAIPPVNSGIVTSSPQNVLTLAPQSVVNTVAASIINFQAQNGKTIVPQPSTSPAISYPPSTFPPAQGTSPGYTPPSNGGRYRYRRNSSPSQPVHKGRDMSYSSSHSYNNHTSDSHTRSEWQSGRRCGYSSKYH